MLRRQLESRSLLSGSTIIAGAITRTMPSAKCTDLRISTSPNCSIVTRALHKTDSSTARTSDAGARRHMIADNCGVVWWFERDGTYFTVEVLCLPNGQYELRFTSADGAERVEHFANATDLANRQQAIHDALIARGWARAREWTL